MRGFDAMDRRAVTAIRVLAIDQVEQARSGHPGLPLGATPMAYVLWSRFLRHDPADPVWPDRDRFVLSAGHGSALLYALLHLFGYDLPLDELKRFRRWGSRTPGHPEHAHTPGVEMTTGPLGQGLASAVGMALAERHLAARFNRPGHAVVDHRTWVLASDGDLMEGISHEAASLAGHLKLGRLVVLYDDNRITIEGSTALAWSDDVEARFRAYGWRTLSVDDGNDLETVAAALADARSREDAPVLVRVRTHIGFGSPHKQDSAEAHGAPLGGDEAVATRRALGCEVDTPFVVPDDVLAHLRELGAARRGERQDWHARLAGYREAHPELCAELVRRLAGELPEGVAAALPRFDVGAALATREASGKTLNALAGVVPELIGGSADLAPSTNTLLKGEADVAPGEFAGRNLHFGIRELGMAAVGNGLALHGGVRPYVATFLVFADYLRPALRLSALMRLPVVYVFTHDSVALGEDGPTHQPIEHLASLRAIPGLVVVRPADARETAAAWRVALERRDGPTVLVLTRQKLPVQAAEGVEVARGATVAAEASGSVPSVVLLATGSEVALAHAVRLELEATGVPTRVVSAPSLELFARQDEAYRDAVLGPGHGLRVAVEMASPQGWTRWVGDDGLVIGLERFGASAPGEEVARRLGFSVESVVAAIRTELATRQVTPVASWVPTGLEGVRAGRIARVESLHVPQRLNARDSALWGERHAKDVARRLGWLDAPTRTVPDLPTLERLAAALAADGARTLYLLGMGGSSLAPQVLRQVLGNPSGREIVVLDTTDPDRVAGILDALDPATAAVMAVSKSGTTAETSSLLEILWDSLRATHGDSTGDRFVALTEPGTPLVGLADERGFRAVLPHPVDVGGRFSPHTAVGAFPSVWLGHDTHQLLASGARALAAITLNHPAIELAALLASISPQPWARLAWCASPGLEPLGMWAEQLVAESTGKDGKGILPVIVSRVPEPAAAWPHTLWLSPRFTDEETGSLDAALDALANTGHPVLRWRLRRDSLGEAFAVLELATAVTGLLLGVNPFDEPDVVRAKERARAALEGGSGDTPTVPEDPGRVLIRHLDGIAGDDAVVLLAYLPENPACAALVDRLATAVGRRTGVVVTAAFGPRYLHSTGQLHKGGPDHIVPIVLTCEPTRDVRIPGRRFTLGKLRYSQAIGDLHALTDVDRRVLHLHLGPDSVAVLARLVAEVEAI
ncbi:MAG: transketolase [Acidobacteria bacterium]|nr:transketolase [Acidobacteriota bacterium]